MIKINMNFPPTYAEDIQLSEGQILNLGDNRVVAHVKMPNREDVFTSRRVEINLDPSLSGLYSSQPHPQDSNFRDSESYHVFLSPRGHERLLAGKQVYVRLDSQLSLWVKPANMQSGLYEGKS